MTDRPVNLDLGVAPQMNMQTQANGERPASRHPGQEHQNLEQDAAKLQDLLNRDDAKPAGSESREGNSNSAPDADRIPFVNGEAGRIPGRGLNLPLDNLTTVADDKLRPAPGRELTPSPINPRPDGEPRPVPDKELKPAPRSETGAASSEPTQTLNPFELFGGMSRSMQSPTSVSDLAPASVPAGESQLAKELEGEIARMARSLMVGEGRHGGMTVRMELSRENYPGVTLEVFRNEGALVAQFVCANEHSRARLARAVSWLGESLSKKLDSDTVIRVQTDDPEDLSPVETRCAASSTSSPPSAYNSYP